MEKVDYGLFMCFAKGISERGDIDWGGWILPLRIFQNFLSCKGKILVGLLVSVATELCSVTHGNCYHFRKGRQLHGKSNRVELIMIEMAERDTDSRVVTHMHALGNVVMRATRIQRQHMVF